MENLGTVIPYLLGFALAATFAILVIGIISFAVSPEFSRKHSNKLMRGRVIAQGLAIALLAILAFVMGSK